MITRSAIFMFASALARSLLLILTCGSGLRAGELPAPTAGDRPSQASEKPSAGTILGERRNWWSLVPVQKPLLPTVTKVAWSDHPIDQFILRRLESEGLSPAAPADARTLIRRLSLTLTGLPPTLAEVQEFCRQADQDFARAYEQLVTRLLGSAHFGERWARHWLDVVRFSETYGYEWNFEIRDAWRYRDYLIRAFNTDLPYDQFVREHLAGDLLPEPRINEQLGINESVIGTAFFRFSETGHDDSVLFPAIRFDPLDNQIDTLSKAFQASTVACARCHDHKLDAISTVDYYALVGILESSRQVIHTLDSVDRFREPVDALRALKIEIRRELSTAWLADLEQLDVQLLAALEPLDPKQDTPTPDTEKEDRVPSVLRSQMSEEELPRNNPGVVLQQLARLPAADYENIHPTWQKLRDEYHREQMEIEKFNADNFEPWGDFHRADNPAWQATGNGLVGSGPSRAGEFTVAIDGGAIVSTVLPAGRYTHVESDLLNGTIRSPWLPKHHRYVSVRFMGGGLGMIRAVLDSCILGENPDTAPNYFAQKTEGWKRFPTGHDVSHRYYVELATKFDNPRWPERYGNESGMDVELRQSPRSWVGIVDAVSHDCPESPREELDHLLTLFADNDPQTMLDVAKAYKSVLHQAVEAFRDQQATDRDVRWINWALATGLLGNSLVEGTSLAELVESYREREAIISPPRVVVGMADQGAGFDFPVLQGGDPEAKGPPAPRGYLQVLTGVSEGFMPTGSGRLELAEVVASPDNPLTARVMVNRIWQHLFGAGIVNTPDDFGRMGDRPSHPELLDYLAGEFVERGWSVKQLIRQIVSSRTFQQASIPTPAANARDAGNRMLHHYPVHRLDAEAIRDTILAISGRLDRLQFGPSIQPYRTEEKLHRKLTSGPLHGNGRRSIYIKVTRMEGNKFLELFDFPDPNATRGKRNRTNVPAQALALMNDPFLIDQAKFWAGRLVEDSNSTTEERIEIMYLTALGRPPTAQEFERMQTLVERFMDLHQVEPDRLSGSALVWKEACHAIFNVKELIYVW